MAIVSEFACVIFHLKLLKMKDCGIQTLSSPGISSMFYKKVKSSVV